MTRVGEALKRKFGPLPAWAWAGIALVAVLFYRRYKGQQDSMGGAVSPISPVGELQGSDQPKRDPVVLQPGESVYDPETGKTTGGGGNDGTEGPPGPQGPPGPAGTPAPRPKRKPPIRKPKPKTGHHPRKPVPHPQHPKRKAVPSSRKLSTIRDNLRKKVSKPAARQGAHPAAPHKAVKNRASVKTPASVPERSRATMPPSAALRQRVAPARVIDHSQQKSVARPAVAKHTPPPPPKPAPKKVVPPKKRK
jgi:hypothetical protein